MEEGYIKPVSIPLLIRKKLGLHCLQNIRILEKDDKKFHVVYIKLRKM